MIKRAILAQQKLEKGRQVWYVRVPKDLAAQGSPRVRFFGDDKKDAVAYAKSLAEARQSSGGTFLKMTLTVRNEIERAVAELGESNVIKALRAWRNRKPESEQLVSEIVVQCLAAKKEAGIRDNSYSSLKSALDSFADFVGTISIGDIGPDHLDKWLKKSKNVKGEPWTPKTKLGRLKDVASFFAFAKRRRIVAANPCDGVEVPRVAFKPVEILTVAEIEKLLKTCLAHDRALLGFICPVLFGGLRVEESLRVNEANFKNGIIDIGGEQTKLNVRRAFAVQPVLKAWLEVDGVVLAGGVNVTKRMRKIRKLAGIKFPPNCLRHSCASYWLQILGAKDAARMLGHSESTLFKHYAAKVTAEEAEAFKALRPDKSIQAIAKPVKLTPPPVAREELYSRVWSKPTMKVAAELGISGKGLAKRCAKANVPTPPLGYWAKVAAGQTPDKAPLVTL